MAQQQGNRMWNVEVEPGVFQEFEGPEGMSPQERVARGRSLHARRLEFESQQAKPQVVRDLEGLDMGPLGWSSNVPPDETTKFADAISPLTEIPKGLAAGWGATDIASAVTGSEPHTQDREFGDSPYPDWFNNMAYEAGSHGFDRMMGAMGPQAPDVEPRPEEGQFWDPETGQRLRDFTGGAAETLASGLGWPVRAGRRALGKMFGGAADVADTAAEGTARRLSRFPASQAAAEDISRRLSDDMARTVDHVVNQSFKGAPKSGPAQMAAWESAKSNLIKASQRFRDRAWKTFTNSAGPSQAQVKVYVGPSLKEYAGQVAKYADSAAGSSEKAAYDAVQKALEQVGEGTDGFVNVQTARRIQQIFNHARDDLKLLTENDISSSLSNFAAGVMDDITDGIARNGDPNMIDAWGNVTALETTLRNQASPAQLLRQVLGQDEASFGAVLSEMKLQDVRNLKQVIARGENLRDFDLLKDMTESWLKNEVVPAMQEAAPGKERLAALRNGWENAQELLGAEAAPIRESMELLQGFLSDFTKATQSEVAYNPNGPLRATLGIIGGGLGFGAGKAAAGGGPWSWPAASASAAALGAAFRSIPEMMGSLAVKAAFDPEARNLFRLASEGLLSGNTSILEEVLPRVAQNLGKYAAQEQKFTLFPGQPMGQAIR